MIIDRIRWNENKTPASTPAAGFVALPPALCQAAMAANPCGVAVIYAMAQEQAQQAQQSRRRKSIFERDLFCCWN